MKKFILGLFLILGAISFAAPKYINTSKLENAVKSSAPDEVKFISSSENKRAYILKYKDTGEIFTYNFVPKKPKSKSCHISVLYMTDKDLSGADLNKVVDSSLNEAESFLK